MALNHAVKAKKTFLIHLAIHYSVPVTSAELAHELAEERDIEVAHDGLAVNLR